MSKSLFKYCQSLLWSSVAMLVFITSCGTPEYLPKEELYEFIDESENLSRTINTGSITMKMSYRPTDFLIWQELEGEKDTNLIKETFHNYNQYLYFVLQLSAGDRDALYGTSANQADFNEKLQTLSFRMQQYVNMTTSENDTIPLADAHYTRMFGMSKTSDILLVFNKEKIDGDEWLAINNKEFGFKTGQRSFVFNTKDLAKAPKLLDLKPYYELIRNN